MPTIYRLKNAKWKITMYFGDHNPPHFHVIHGTDDVLIEIETMRALAGSVPASSLKAARKWAGANRRTLNAKWRKLHE